MKRTKFALAVKLVFRKRRYTMDNVFVLKCLVFSCDRLPSDDIFRYKNEYVPDVLYDVEYLWIELSNLGNFSNCNGKLKH